LAQRLLLHRRMMEAKMYTADATVSMKPTAAKAGKLCKCGHDVNHPQIAPEPVYTNGSWLLFLIGVTAKPSSVVYRCVLCKQILASTRDPKVLSRFD
jgi:hypothetical protein